MVFWFQLYIIYIVDWYMAKDGGYCLNANSAYIWPTSANTSIERPRLNEFRADFTKLWGNFYVRKLTRTLFKRLPNRIRDFLKLKSLWLKAL